MRICEEESFISGGGGAHPLHPPPMSLTIIFIYTHVLEVQRWEIFHVPTAVVDEHAVTLTIFNIESKRKVECLRFLH